MSLELLTVFWSLGPLDVARVPVQSMHVTDCGIDSFVLELLGTYSSRILDLPLTEPFVECGPIGHKVLAKAKCNDQSECNEECEQEHIGLPREASRHPPAWLSGAVNPIVPYERASRAGSD